MYMESHSSKTHTTPQVAFCSDCGKQYFLSHLTFTQTRGLCSCSWSCCETASPSNRPHPRHIVTRPAVDVDFAEVTAGRLRDFRNL